MATTGVADGVDDVVLFRVGVARAEVIPANVEHGIARLADNGFGRSGVGLPRGIVLQKDKARIPNQA